MKMRTIGYWATTGLAALAFGAGGASYLAHTPSVVEGIAHLGYPPYFVTLLGTWKVLGAMAILAPRLPLLKEWAYAGLFFDVTGAAVSHAASGDGAGMVVVPLVVLALVAASWALRPASRRLTSPAAAMSETAPAAVRGDTAIAS